MYRQPPLFSRPVLDGKKVLLVDANQATRDVRAEVLRDHGVMVHAVEDFSGARVLWQPNFYDLILLNLRRHSPGEAFQFYEQVKDASPRERFAFLLGPPVYLSLTWPDGISADDVWGGQWGEMVKRVVTTAA
jgi:hypothetical protein